ncbi:MAG: RNA polymerase factor sigma-54 [FCB group bacterium]|nr:RNA polymerase factor sigma-54 [FCB group bacterium]
MKQKLSQQQIQKLAPLQLMLARLSQLSQSDLEQAIFKEVEINPLLEIDDMKAPAGTDFREEMPYYSAPLRSEGDLPDLPRAEELDFFDLLLLQVKESGMREDEIRVAEEIIGNLDENGFLSGTPISNIAYKLSVPEDTATHVLRQVQALGPAGIAARDLKECMLLQLHARGEEPFVITMIEDHYEDFMTARYDDIRKAMALSEESMQYAREQIARLNPKPAAGHDDYLKRSIIPDVLLREKNGTFYIALNETGIPGVRLSETYLGMLNEKGLDTRTKRYLNGNKQAALWFIQAIEQRKHSLIAVAQSIVRRQHDFLSGKREYPIPLVMKTIAADTGLDISTVSRIVNGKYMQTPLGIFELRYFFSEQAGRSDQSLRSTRDLEKDLLEIIDGEDKRQPFNDEALRAELGKRNYRIARRTVAKYREKLGIPDSRERRKK